MSCLSRDQRVGSLSSPESMGSLLKHQRVRTVSRLERVGSLSRDQRVGLCPEIRGSSLSRD